MAIGEARAVEPSVHFYYPRSTVYPVDGVCTRIVKALEKRNWRCKGIEVIFEDLQYNSETYRKVHKIKGEHFLLSFGRIQGMICVWNDTAAIECISLPKKELSLFADYSGPTFKVYRQNQLMESSSEADLRDVSTYHGGSLPDEAPRYYWGPLYIPIRPTLLLEKYGDSPGASLRHSSSEPAFYKTNAVFDQFVRYLEVVVLKPIEAS